MITSQNAIEIMMNDTYIIILESFTVCILKLMAFHTRFTEYNQST